MFKVVVVLHFLETPESFNSAHFTEGMLNFLHPADWDTGFST